MDRRFFFQSSMICGASIWSFGWKGLFADSTANLASQLKAGLKVRKPSEQAFITQVVTLVDKKVLPLPLVLSVFQYARKKEQRYPFFYFQRALKIRAAKELGVKL